ncbi:hypothetical protein ES708_05646 [subsurface metagenome]
MILLNIWYRIIVKCSGKEEIIQFLLIRETIKYLPFQDTGN